MNRKRLFKLFLVAVAIASALSSCCCINERLGAYGIGPGAPLDVSPPINGDATHQLALQSLNCD